MPEKEKKKGLEPIKLGEYLTWLKKEIKTSEDEITPIREEFKSVPPNETEARELYFRTQEVEIEFEFGVERTDKGKIQAYIFALGREKRTMGKQKIRIKLVSQGHRFSSSILRTTVE